MGFAMSKTHKKLGRKLGYSSAQFVSNFERGLCAPPLSRLRKMIVMYELEPESVMQVILAGTKKELSAAIR